MASRRHKIKKRIVSLLKDPNCSLPSDGVICRMFTRSDLDVTKVELADAMNSLYRERIIRLRQRKPFSAFIMGQVEAVFELTAKGIKTKRYG